MFNVHSISGNMSFTTLTIFLGLQIHLIATAHAQFLFPRATTLPSSSTGTIASTTAPSSTATAPDVAYIGFSSIGGIYSQIDCEAPYDFRYYGNYTLGTCCIPKVNCNPIISCTSGSVAVFKDNSQSTW
jgi:hypothetical protein